jgi:hypothetical protein
MSIRSAPLLIAFELSFLSQSFPVIGSRALGRWQIDFAYEPPPLMGFHRHRVLESVGGGLEFLIEVLLPRQCT